MRADSININQVFSSGGAIHYVLPHFQREYTWEKANWETLLNDALQICEEAGPIGDDDEIDLKLESIEHFLGSLVVIGDGTRRGTVSAFKLVDGQQRLTSISLLLCALRSHISEEQNGWARKITKSLVNEDEDGEVHFKLLPTPKYGDRTAYQAIVTGKEVPVVASKIPPAYKYFCSELGARLREGLRPALLYQVLMKSFQVVFIVLNANESPYKIFESLNAKGKALSQADLVRNYIAMRLPSRAQDEAWAQWSRIEELLSESRIVGRRLGELTAFLRHHNAMHTGNLCAEEHVYARFRDRCERDFDDPQSFVSEIESLRRAGERYNELLRPHQSNRSEKWRDVMARLNVLEVSTAYPLLLRTLQSADEQELTESELIEACELIENFLVRRVLTGVSTSAINKWFPSLWNHLDCDNFCPSLRVQLAGRYYQNNQVVSYNIRNRAFAYSNDRVRSRLVLLLERINQHLSHGTGGFTVLDGTPTIEHILPQTPNATWQRELGDDWENALSQNLNRLGNLTLVTGAWNSTLSNKPFVDKKPLLQSHALKINSEFFERSLENWTPGEIAERGEWLTEQILDIWPSLVPERVATEVITKTPHVLVIKDCRFLVQSWRDTLRRLGDYLSSQDTDFSVLARQFPSSFQQTPFNHASHPLRDGWHLQVNLSAQNTFDLLQRLLKVNGIEADEWSLEFE